VVAAIQQSIQPKYAVALTSEPQMLLSATCVRATQHTCNGVPCIAWVGWKMLQCVHSKVGLCVATLPATVLPSCSSALTPV